MQKSPISLISKRAFSFMKGKKLDLQPKFNGVTETLLNKSLEPKEVHASEAVTSESSEPKRIPEANIPYRNS